MNPELGVVLFVALLWGPTALWLAYRALRGHQGGLAESSTAVSKPMRSLPLAPDELEALVDSDAFWVCGTCRSLNRREGNRCYSCRTAKGIAGRQAPGQLPVSRGFPVMAEGIARSPRRLPVSRGVPVMAEGIARSPRQLPVSRGVPVTAEGIARSSGAAAGTMVALAAPRNAPAAPETLVPAPGHLLSTSLLEAPAGVPVCPFLGWRDDPATRYDFPDRGNLCHASSERGSTSVASSRPVPTGTRRPQPIDVEYQSFRCLTAAHGQCSRYVAVEVVAAKR